MDIEAIVILPDHHMTHRSAATRNRPGLHLLCDGIEADQHVQRAARTGVAYEDYRNKNAKEIPVGRMGKPEEFANLACLLVSDAGSYITGTAINVDGGRSPVV